MDTAENPLILAPPCSAARYNASSRALILASSAGTFDVIAALPVAVVN